MQIDITYLAIVLVVILISMTLHEAMHAYAGYWLGDDTARLSGRLTLNPIAHIDPMMTVALPLFLAAIGAPPFGAAKPVPFNPQNVRYGEWGAAIVGLAGPFTNFFLAFIGFVVLVATGMQFTLSGTGVVELFLTTFVFVNLAFFVFNMLPIPPLDGSRALYAIAPDSVRSVMEMMEQYGIFVVFAIILLFNAQLSLFMQSAINAILTLFSLPFGG
jgi:Zn-dependent protease